MSKINGLHEFNFGVIFLILTYFVSRWLQQLSTHVNPPPPSQVIHRFCTGCPRLWITLVCLWITLGSVDSLWITLGATLAWFVHGLTSVWTCVGPFGPTFISRTHATSIQHGLWSIVQTCEIFTFTSVVVPVSWLHQLRRQTWDHY